MLFYLSAVNAHGDLTKLGEDLSKFPLDPVFAKAIIIAHVLGEEIKDKKVLEDTVKLVSVMSTENIWTNVSRADSHA
jgi:HrpA-like RNA helicase